MRYDEQLAPGDADRIARSHREWVRAAGYDPHSVYPLWPSVDQLAAADTIVIARDDNGIRAYGRMIGWSETDGTHVRLLDVHSAPGPARAATEEELFHRLERSARETNQQHVVLAANAAPGDLLRSRTLEKLGYQRVFDMHELELQATMTRKPLPTAITVRPARHADAVAITALTAENWSGRMYFAGLTLADATGWLGRADPELFLLAESDGRLVGLAAASINDRNAEVDDLGVIPDWRRRGLASALLTELLARLRRRTRLPVRLVTEGHDPACALTLYRRLGFTTVARFGRYRKAMPGAGSR